MKRTHFVSFFAAFAAVLVLGLAGCNQPNSNNTASDAGTVDVASLAGKVWEVKDAETNEVVFYAVLDLKESKIYAAEKHGTVFVKVPDEKMPLKIENNQIKMPQSEDQWIPLTAKKSGDKVELYASQAGLEEKIATLSPAESNITVEQIKKA